MGQAGSQLMDARTGKAIAKKVGLELYYDAQWASWGLIDPDLRVESLWLSPNRLKALGVDEFNQHYIAVMVERVCEAAERH
jgi:hypothetical protein